MQVGLRERKKMQTRQALMSAAVKLYLERGFDGVTIADIATAAGVSTRTFFSYFECKEDVFLGPGDDRLQRVMRAIEGRKPNEPILAAAWRELGREKPRSAVRAERPELRRLLEHPSVRERLRERWNRWEDALSECIAREVGAREGDAEPRVVGAAITGAIRVAASAAQHAPGRRPQIAKQVFALLATGLADYGRTGRSRRGHQRSITS